MDVSLELWFAVIGGAVAVAAAIVLGLWQVIRPEDGPRARLVALAAVGGWLAIDIVLAMTGVFAAEPDGAVPFIALGLMAPLATGVWLLSRPGPVRDVVERVPVPWLVGVQVYRVIGGVFLLAWAQGRLPAEFALPAGLGDVAIGVAAPLVAWNLARRPQSSARVAVLWNLAGIADLVVAVTLGFLTSPSPYQQLSLADPNWVITRLPFVLVPLFAVPLSVLLHVAALRRLGGPQPHRGVAVSVAWRSRQRLRPGRRREGSGPAVRGC